MSRLQTLESRWIALVAQHEQSCKKAWRIAEVPDLDDDEQSEIAHLEELIAFAKLYIDEEVAA